MTRVELGWPHRDLSPNARPHHMAKWRANKDALVTAAWATRAAIGRDKFVHDG